MTEPNWREIAERLYPVAMRSGCLCEYERAKGGVPMWFPMEGGGIGRKLIKQCSRCVVDELYRSAGGAAA
jgi:hypothetical protein